jgi:hypothetical protein
LPVLGPPSQTSVPEDSDSPFEPFMI